MHSISSGPKIAMSLRRCSRPTSAWGLTTREVSNASFESLTLAG